MHGKRLRGGDDVTIGQTESSRCWFLLVISGQLGLLYASAVRAAAQNLAGADCDSMVSQHKEKLSSISCFLSEGSLHDA